jgi:hypothetical protein
MEFKLPSGFKNDPPGRPPDEDPGSPGGGTLSNLDAVDLFAAIFFCI